MNELTVWEKIENLNPYEYKHYLTNDELEEVLNEQMKDTYALYPYQPEEFISEHEQNFKTASEICDHIDNFYNKSNITEAFVNEWWNGACLYRENENLKLENENLRKQLEYLIENFDIPAPKKEFKVKIIKAKSEKLWYNDEIGKILNVVVNDRKDEFSDFEYQESKNGYGIGVFLYKEDIEIIK